MDKQHLFRRALPATFARAEPGVDDAGDGKPKRIVGLCAVYGAEYRVGDEEWGYVETFEPGSLQIDQDAFSCYNHNVDYALGRLSNDTLKLEGTPEGVRLEVEPNQETSYGKDVLALVDRRDVVGMSITFSYYGEYGDYEYTYKSDEWDTLVVKRATLFEAGPVLNPAYKETSAELRMQRSIAEGLHNEHKARADMERFLARAEDMKLDDWLAIQGAA